ncbi:hypothetical protein [Desulfofustis glycolicus]|uniref:Uncharacterized protein n=1 Tax=Desulfofustis glycolicus DSM 9705 TaxID=1121409 RepID=A0A1M5S416_9BACT|nr:hypothetical protein [Desulfofustis glycolicus]SHH33180.1 hypothetical protein SAMN02745124_00149 [Desulfofustis glycolicus DSM 9705]
MSIIPMMLQIGERSPIAHRHKLAGTVTVDGLPARRTIVAFDRRNLDYAGSTISDAETGKWDITNLNEFPERTLLVVAFDTTGYYNAEVADYITQVATVES